MSTWRRVAAAGILALFAVGSRAVPHAEAATSGGGTGFGWNNITPTQISAGLGVPGGIPAPSGGGASGGATSSCQWTYVGKQENGNGIDTDGNVLLGAGGGFSGSDMTPVANGATGDWYLMTCPGQSPVSIFVPAGAGGSAPPPPPGPAEAAAATPFPVETIHFNPCGTGVTGLTSWFWATVGTGAGTAVPPIAATASIRGYTVRVAAQPVSYRWDITGVSSGVVGIDASLVGTSSGTLVQDPDGGLSSDPSVSWMPQTKGIYNVTLTVTWSGQYTFSGYGINQTSALGPVAQAPVVRPMPVEEIRSVLLSPDATEPPTTRAPPLDPFTC